MRPRANTARRAPATLLNAEPPPCRPPICFEPPWPLVDRPELWVVTTAPRDEWSGAGVAWSEDADTYGDAPMIGHAAVAGRLLDPLAPAAIGQGVRIACDDGGKLASVDEPAARRLQSECYLGDGRNTFELVAFTGLTLLAKDDEGAFVYRLHGLLMRGAYGTTVRAWPAGTRFARLDGHVSRIVLPHRLVVANARLWLKLGAINAAGHVDSVDDPAEAEPIPYDIQGTFHQRPRGRD